MCIRDSTHAHNPVYLRVVMNCYQDTKRQLSNLLTPCLYKSLTHWGIIRSLHTLNIYDDFGFTRARACVYGWWLLRVYSLYGRSTYYLYCTTKNCHNLITLIKPRIINFFTKFEVTLSNVRFRGYVCIIKSWFYVLRGVLWFS